MTATDLPPIRIHQDPVLFREAVNYTTADTGFAPRLIEKDYFCTVVLGRAVATVVEVANAIGC